jgi:hypothetical protein
MEDLFSRWKTRIPKYSEEFQYLFDSLSNKGGGSSGKQINLGKHFGNNYEFYLYAFFLGLYKPEYIPIPEHMKKNDFNHAIQKSGVSGRKDYSSLQENIFASLIAKTDFDFIALEKGELTEDAAVKTLINTMEGYTNGGLTAIKEKFEDSPNYFLHPTAFLNLMLSIKTDFHSTIAHEI